MKNKSEQLCSPKNRKQKQVKVLLLIVGTFSLVLGAIGNILAHLPTTPFFCYPPLAT